MNSQRYVAAYEAVEHMTYTKVRFVRLASISAPRATIGLLVRTLPTLMYISIHHKGRGKSFKTNFQRLNRLHVDSSYPSNHHTYLPHRPSNCHHNKLMTWRFMIGGCRKIFLEINVWTTYSLRRTVLTKNPSGRDDSEVEDNSLEWQKEEWWAN